jgi:hypothetical protein
MVFLTLHMLMMTDCYLGDNSAMSPEQRCRAAALAFVQELADLDLRDQENVDQCTDVNLAHMLRARTRIQEDMLQAYATHSVTFLKHPTTAEYLGDGTKEVYNFVRKTLDIPVHRGLQDHPVNHGVIAADSNGEIHPGKETVGSRVSKIYHAIRNGCFAQRIMAITQELDI